MSKFSKWDVNQQVSKTRIQRAFHRKQHKESNFLKAAPETLFLYIIKTCRKFTELHLTSPNMVFKTLSSRKIQDIHLYPLVILCRFNMIIIIIIIIITIDVLASKRYVATKADQNLTKQPTSTMDSMDQWMLHDVKKNAYDHSNMNMKAETVGPFSKPRTTSGGIINLFVPTWIFPELSGRASIRKLLLKGHTSHDVNIDSTIHWYKVGPPTSYKQGYNPSYPFRRPLIGIIISGARLVIHWYYASTARGMNANSSVSHYSEREGVAAGSEEPKSSNTMAIIVWYVNPGVNAKSLAFPFIDVQFY